MVIDKCFLKIQEASSEIGKYAVLQFALCIMSILLTAANKDTGVSCIKNKISDVIEYINQNLNKKLSLDSVANATFVSKYYLCHIFRATVGMTVGEYITFTRLSKAKQLLRTTEDSISDISFATGFESFAYFSKVFREHEGITPSECRKKSRGI